MVSEVGMKFIAWSIPLAVAAGIAAVVSCSSEPSYSSSGGYGGGNYSVSANNPGMRSGKPAMAPRTLLRQVNIRKDLIPSGTHARRHNKSMKPRYITIHSTQNYSAAADAMQHSRALKNGKLRAYKRRGGNRIGYLAWHYSIDQGRVVQHIPDNEQGEHADFDGPGNNYSLGLEMCENRGNSRAATVERTAKLAAYLMYKHNIPISGIKAHYHWTRHGLSKPNKNCPHFLMDNGRPGRKWAAFVAKVNGYYKLITEPTRMAPMPAPAPTPAPTAPIPVPVVPAPYYQPYQQPYSQSPYTAPAAAPSYPQYSSTPQYQPSRTYPAQPYNNSGSNPYGVPSLR